MLVLMLDAGVEVDVNVDVDVAALSFTIRDHRWNLALALGPWWPQAGPPAPPPAAPFKCLCQPPAQKEEESGQGGRP